jgi:hypothetical protein
MKEDKMLEKYSKMVFSEDGINSNVFKWLMSKCGLNLYNKKSISDNNICFNHIKDSYGFSRIEVYDFSKSGLDAVIGVHHYDLNNGNAEQEVRELVNFINKIKDKYNEKI